MVIQGARVAVFGAGYIGLVTAACFAELGHSVRVRDIDASRVEALRRGRVPIYEPGLDALLARNAERLLFTLDVDEAVSGVDVVYVCVDTPPSVSGDADLSRVWAVVDSLRGAAHVKALVIKSTVPVGTGEKVRAALDAAGLGHVGYAANPEFTAEGQAVQDFMSPDRVVVGAWDEETARLVAGLHAGVDGPVVTMDVASAEMVKLASNALLATKISFINEIANVCEKTGADITHVADAVGLDHRLGPHFLQAGLGWGGSCFPKDARALKQLASNTGYPFQLLTAVIEVNDLQQRRPVQTVKELLGGLVGRRVAVLGMTFKAGTDDMRESPATVIVSRLLAEGAQVTCWDPLAKTPTGEPWEKAERFDEPLAALDEADAVIIATGWPQLVDIPWEEAAGRMRQPVIVDGRNLLDPVQARAAGFVYAGVGRPRTVTP